MQLNPNWALNNVLNLKLKTYLITFYEHFDEEDLVAGVLVCLTLSLGTVIHLNYKGQFRALWMAR